MSSCWLRINRVGYNCRFSSRMNLKWKPCHVMKWLNTWNNATNPPAYDTLNTSLTNWAKQVPTFTINWPNCIWTRRDVSGQRVAWVSEFVRRCAKLKAHKLLYTIDPETESYKRLLQFLQESTQYHPERLLGRSELEGKFRARFCPTSRHWYSGEKICREHELCFLDV
jgi:hypothetical protein